MIHLLDMAAWCPPLSASIPGCAVLLSSSQSDEEAGRVGESKDKDVVGLIRPVKDLSIWLAEDQVGALLWKHFDRSSTGETFLWDPAHDDPRGGQWDCDALPPGSQPGNPLACSSS